MATTKTTRVFAFLGALLFFVTTCAVTGAVVWQIQQDNKANKAITEATKAANDQSKLNTTNGDQNSTNQAEVKGENTLQGKPLANFTAIPKIDTLTSTDTKVGDGAEVKAGDTITAHYTGAVASTGVVFQSSHDTGAPATFPLSGVIKGWQEGVPGMKVGGTRRLLIPAALAYGSNPPQGIPVDADLVFDIELVSIGE